MKHVLEHVGADFKVFAAVIAFAMDVDFEPESIVQSYDPYWWAKVEAGDSAATPCASSPCSSGMSPASCR
jgi:hypothetical protein